MALAFGLPATASVQTKIILCGYQMLKFGPTTGLKSNTFHGKFTCLASKRRDKGKTLKEPSNITSMSEAPQLGSSIDKSSKVVFDQKFLDKLEEVKKSAIEKKTAEERKSYETIDYDSPIESDQSTIGFGTKVGIGLAVVVFGLVFAFGDFLPYGSVNSGKEGTEIRKQLTEAERMTFKRAFDEYEAKLRESPKDAAALEGAAVTLVELGEYDKVVPFLEMLIKESPAYADAYRLLGEVKYELKDYDGSASSFKMALSLSDNMDFEVLQGLTNTLLASQKPDEAVKVLLSAREKIKKEIQQNAVDSKESQNKSKIDPIQVELLIGKAYSDWGHLSDAVAVYDKLMREHPNDFRGYLAKGIILKQNGKVGDAERMFIQAKFFAPEAAKALVDRYSRS
ncbi:Tetratricopeptide repeat (TPR)-like superfamily protein [Rhynchospora pubera]|uniref:Tetratricopeptide repeat (TPR)-like superfamily protein n=1 Tax=Rhynchospora pubera TaxID=906938 RepID=A0AAV8FX22_9POAL|nr:Tetratricopeptide repeat (TPR)-like superfamily protein [Rhynchospora pubera]KAJ4798020.1 Tetratricopeptide repeat (TPR)-like superfamily protein [Rhynchospora pubera]